MNNVAVRHESAVWTEELSTEDLYAELQATIEITAKHLQRLAEIWRELERRGQDLSRLRSGLWAYMPHIASGRLNAQVVIKYAGNVALLRRLATLDLDQQARLLTDDTVAVVQSENGEKRTRWIPVQHLTMRQMDAVLVDGKLLAPDRQLAVQAETVKKKRTGVTIESIAQTRPSRLSRGRDKSVVAAIVMTPHDLDIIKRRAMSAGVSLSSFVRAALIKAGALD